MLGCILETLSATLIVQGLLFIFYPSGNVGGLIQTAAVIVIAAIVMIVLGAAMIIAPENVIANVQIGIGWILILNAVINVWYIV